MRLFLTLFAGGFSLWFSVQIFGWIVSGDVAVASFHVRRDDGASKFWLWVTLLALLCCAFFGVTLALFWSTLNAP